MLRNEWKSSIVDVADNATTVNAVPTLVNAIYINTALSSHALLVKDGTATKYVVPASAAAGTRFEFGPTIFSTSMIIDPDDGASGSITVEYVDLERM